jgi:glycosyltransferase involved in cell wall biosynthesis
LENKFVVLYSGNMARFHEFDTILNAALKLKDHPDIRFVFVGDGYHKKTILSFIERYLLLNCQMHDYVARDDLPDLLALGDVGLVSLLDGFEGLSVPSKTFGLMAAGVPVLGVLPRDSEIAHLVSEYHAGYVVSSGDVDGFVENVMTLFSSPVLLGEMADRGQTACLKHHRLSLIAQQYVDLLTRL